jgi:hypothetical protein
MPAPTDDPDRWRRCVHEAGHCLISRLAGLGWGAGSTVAYGRGFTWCNHDDGRAGIAVGLAGLCAELLVLGQASELGISIDAGKIEELRRHNGFSDADILALADKVEGLLREHRDVLERIAVALDPHESLAGVDIDALVGDIHGLP